MSLLQKTVRSVLKPVKHDMPSRCTLETAQDSTTFVTSDSGLLSIFALNGVKTVPGDPASMQVFEVLERVISLGCKSMGHSFTFIFENDPQSIMRELNDATESVRVTIDRIGLDLHDVYNDLQSKVGNYCQTERNWLIVYTSPSAISPEILKKAMADKSSFFKESGVPSLASAQDTMKAIEDLVNPHHSLCDRILQDVSRCNFDLKLLNVVDALKQLRYCIDPDQTSHDWKPVLFLNRRSPPISLVDDENAGDFWFPRIGKQLFSQGVDVVKDNDFPGEMVRLGGRYYSTMAMEVFPENIESFSSLFSKTDFNMPWRIAIDIRPGGLKTKSITRMYTKLFGWMGRANREIKQGFDYVEQAVSAGDTDVGITFSATTWSRKPRDLAVNEAKLIRTLQSWGVTQVVTRMGDPIAAWCATLPGFTRKRASEVTCAPLSEVMPMLPLQRPTSPWPVGAALTRSIDGKLMPIQTSSSKQITWNELVYAPPGSGKSVLVNTLTLAMVLSPGLTKLPRIAHLDIGPSGSGVVSLIKSALPEGRKHEAQFIKLAMSEAYAINPFDTQLGLRRPTQIERDFLVNLLCLFCTPAGYKEPYALAGEMSGLIVDEVYKKYSDKTGSPKLYETSVCKEVNQVLNELQYDIDPEDPPSWWHIVDVLFDAGRIHEASLAQRYAVPVLEDLITIAQSEVVRDLFSPSKESQVKTSTGQSLTDTFNTVISSARREYPILSGVTRFDVSDSRIVILDLNDVAKGGGAEGKKRSALMYMLGRQATTKNFYLSEEMLDECHDRYKEYHIARIQEIRAEKKAIIYDEFHNTGGMEALRKQVGTDMREGRKWNVRVMLSSQILTDFDEDMIKVATSVYILKAGTASAIDEVVGKFGLSEGARRILRDNLKGPRAYGAPFFGYFQTKEGDYSQLFVNTIGPVLNWALTTTSEDMALRKRMYDSLPAADARTLLARVFPGGSCVDAVKAKEISMDVNETKSGVDLIAEDLLGLYYRDLSKVA